MNDNVTVPIVPGGNGEPQRSGDPNVLLVVDRLCSAWGNCPYPQLSVLIVFLKFLATVHQTGHWVTKGDPFYGDHQLFSRLYEKVTDEIDSAAEKAVGLGTSNNVDMVMQTKQVAQLVAVSNFGGSTIPNTSDVVRKSLAAETYFSSVLDILVDQMAESGTLTRGLDNMLAQIADDHEGHVYLLKQRCTNYSVVQGMVP